VPFAGAASNPLHVIIAMKTGHCQPLQNTALRESLIERLVARSYPVIGGTKELYLHQNTTIPRLIFTMIPWFAKPFESASSQLDLPSRYDAQKSRDAVATSRYFSISFIRCTRSSGT